MLKTKNEYDKQKHALIEANDKALAKQRNYIYLALGGVLIFAVVSFLVFRSKRSKKD